MTRGAALLPAGRMAKDFVQITNDVIEGVGLAGKVSPDTMKLRFVIDGSDCDQRCGAPVIERATAQYFPRFRRRATTLD